MRKLLRRLVVWVGGALLLALVVAIGLQWLLSLLALERNPPPGELVLVSGRQMHLLCHGQGAPAVILESGLPGTSLGWAAVIEDIASFTRVCAYDRAGFAWSEAGPEPRTAGNLARELRDLLSTAGVDPPFVLSGHSFGGVVVQVFASQFQDEVAGLVLVDAPHPDITAHSPPGHYDRMKNLALMPRFLGPLGVARLTMPMPTASPDSRPSSVQATEKQLLATTRSFRTMASELEVLGESMNQVAETPPRLGQKPLIVLTKGRRRKGMEHVDDTQEGHTELSENSDWRVISGAGHFIHHEDPAVVVDAIRSVVESARNPPADTAASE